MKGGDACAHACIGNIAEVRYGELPPGEAGERCRLRELFTKLVGEFQAFQVAVLSLQFSHDYCQRKVYLPSDPEIVFGENPKRLAVPEAGKAICQGGNRNGIHTPLPLDGKAHRASERWSVELLFRKNILRSVPQKARGQKFVGFIQKDDNRRFRRFSANREEGIEQCGRIRKTEIQED